MLIQLFVGMLNLSLPPLLAYAIFLWIKAAKPIARGIYIKILACGIPVLVLIHFMIMVSAGQLLFNKDQRHARNGIYINRELADTVKLADDSLCILYNPKDSLKRIKSKYNYSLNEKTIFESGPGQPTIAVSLKYLLNRKPVTGDVTAPITLDTAKNSESRYNNLLHYRMKLTKDTLLMNTGKDTTQLIKFTKLTS